MAEVRNETMVLPVTFISFSDLFLILSFPFPFRPSVRPSFPISFLFKDSRWYHETSLLLVIVSFLPRRNFHIPSFLLLVKKSSVK